MTSVKKMQEEVFEKIRLRRKETKLHADEELNQNIHCTHNTASVRPGTAVLKTSRQAVCYQPKGSLTFSSSSMLQIIWAQVVKISTARERVRIPYTWKQVTV